MPKRAFNPTIIIKKSDDMPVPYEGDLITLITHRNYEVIDVVGGDTDHPIITIRETVKDALST